MIGARAACVLALVAALVAGCPHDERDSRYLALRDAFARDVGNDTADAQEDGWEDAGVTTVDSFGRDGAEDAAAVDGGPPCPPGVLQLCGTNCVNVRMDSQNCGRCGVTCVPRGTTNYVCTDGGCVPDRCPVGRRLCDGQCIDPMTNPQHCTACGVACIGTNTTGDCVGGVCTCAPGYGNCDGTLANGCEAEFATNATHCGACNARCGPYTNATGVACVGGRCAVTACGAGYADCDRVATNGCETPLNTSANCGRCGNACHATQTCANGMCVCAMGRSDCDGNAMNGCEVDLATNAAHCGRCDAGCLSDAGLSGRCREMRCEVCMPGMANCDGNAANGCETNLVNDRNNCGRCRNLCDLNGAVCLNSVCTCAPIGERCTAASQCCDLRGQCRRREAGDEGGVCCLSGGASCSTGAGAQCCGRTLCIDGFCTSLPLGAFCANDGDCVSVHCRQVMGSFICTAS